METVVQTDLVRELIPRLREAGAEDGDVVELEGYEFEFLEN